MLLDQSILRLLLGHFRCFAVDHERGCVISEGDSVLCEGGFQDRRFALKRSLVQ